VGPAKIQVETDLARADLRKEVEMRLGSRFDQLRYHDFIVSQGLLPPDLLRSAVMNDFIGAEASR
jgi:uncharacterized protein (DUF885 family)